MRTLLCFIALLGFSFAQVQPQGCADPTVQTTATEIYQTFTTGEVELLEASQAETLVDQLELFGFMVSEGFTSLWDMRSDDDLNSFIPMIYEATGEVIIVVFIPGWGVCVYGQS